MKILLVNPYRNIKPPRELVSHLRNTQLWDGGEENFDFGTYPLEVPYLGAILWQVGHEVSFVDAQRIRLLPTKIDFSGYDAVVTCTAPFGKWRCPPFSYQHAIEVLREAQKAGCKMIVYGPHCTVDPESFLEAADCVIRGEPEPSILEALTINSSIIGKPCTDNYNLDELPFPAFDLIDFSLYDAKYIFESKVTDELGVLAGSRGCPYRCVFCFKVMVPERMRFHSPQRAVKMAETLVNEFGCKALIWGDLTFTLSKKWTLEVCEGLKELKVPYSASTRSDCLDEEVVEALASSGCYAIDVGVESGSNQVLQLLNKGFTWEESAKAINLCRQAGIPLVRVFLLLFAPGETRETIKETLGKISSLGMDISFSICTPYPGTDLWEMGVREGKIPRDLEGWSKKAEVAARLAGTIGTDFTREEVIQINKRLSRQPAHLARMVGKYYRVYGPGALVKKGIDWIKKQTSST